MKKSTVSNVIFTKERIENIDNMLSHISLDGVFKAESRQGFITADAFNKRMIEGFLIESKNKLVKYLEDL